MRRSSLAYHPTAGSVRSAILLCLLTCLTGCGLARDSAEFVAVGIPTSRMSDSAAEQIGSNWCWAACIQMVLSTKGVESEQPEIVVQTFGDTADRPASAQHIAERLTGWFESRSGRTLLVASTLSGPPQLGMLYSYLRSRTPVIVAVRYPGAAIGHAMVVTGAVFRISSDGLVLEKVNVRDPNPELASSKGKRELTPEEFRNTGEHVVLDVVRRQ